MGVPVPGPCPTSKITTYGWVLRAVRLCTDRHGEPPQKLMGLTRAGLDAAANHPGTTPT
ncbi:hypothetical protein [Streptomyces sp. NPDC020983]|uniref:hypothetical protein n=1 Tax=Streptomyces sp. NPDC020983 TaxID=3365106 RepID=UPI0037B53033